MKTTKKKTRKKSKILVLHGPNLHLLGKREPDLYGTCTLADINRELKRRGQKCGCEITVQQLNEEGKLVEAITKTRYDFLIINPAAYTHTSVAIRDALLAVKKPCIEVHLSNIYKREEFRKRSLINDIVLGSITGLGPMSYFLALEAACDYLATGTPH